MGNSIVEGAKIAEDKKHTISHANTAFLGLDIEVDHLLTKMEKDNLPAEIQKLCSGMQVYKVRYVPSDMSQEEYNSVPFDDENLNTTSLVATDIRKGTDRVKRQITTCSNNKEKCTYNRNWGRTCRWLICGRVENPDHFRGCADLINQADQEIAHTFRAVETNALHVASAVRRCTFCCEDRDTNRDSCKCSKIVDRNSFNRCQLKNDCGMGLTKS